MSEDPALQSSNARPGAEDKGPHLEVPQLRKLLSAVLELAHVRLLVLVHNLVGTHVAALREPLAAGLAAIWPLPRMPSLVCLRRDVSPPPEGCHLLLGRASP